MPRCSICLQERTSLRFKTGRMSICGFCVGALNRTSLSPRDAERNWLSEFRENILRNRPDAISWVGKWLERCGNWIVSEKLCDPENVRASHELKVIRAHRAGLVCLNRQYLDYPGNWEFKRYRTKHLDREMCLLCGPRGSKGQDLHVHHIIFRSRSGTNSYRNLVTLCFRHHQAQHPHTIGDFGGEASGSDTDSMPEALDALHCQEEAHSLPASFSESAYFAARPTFETALTAFRENGKTTREFFAFLIQTFGVNVGRYALRFAEEESLRREFKKGLADAV